jgi:hypothetical protein
VAHDICYVLRICLGEVLMAPSESDGSIVVVVVVIGSSLTDTSELKILLLMSYRLSVGSTVTSSLNSIYSTVIHRLLLQVFDLLRPWLLLLMKCYYPIRVSKVCEALCGLAYSHCACSFYCNVLVAHTRNISSDCSSHQFHSHYAPLFSVALNCNLLPYALVCHNIYRKL